MSEKDPAAYSTAPTNKVRERTGSGIRALKGSIRYLLAPNVCIKEEKDAKTYIMCAF